MKKFSEIFLTGVFGIFLIVSMVMTVSNREDVYSYYENRLYAEMPEISAENVIEGDFFNQLESFLCDHAAGRQTLVKAKTETDIRLLKRPVVNDVVIGDDVLLPFNAFEKVDRGQVEEQAEFMASQHARLRDLVESYGGTYLYTAVPCQYVCYEDAYPFYLNNRREFTGTEISALTDEMEKYGVSHARYASGI